MNTLDIIIPVHNEAKNLPLLIKRLSDAMATSKIPYRVIAVDDHSTDRTSSILLRLSSKYPITIVPNSDKPGKAFAILTGAKHAEGGIVAFIDADLQYPPESIPDMMDQMSKSVGVVVANRKTYKSSWFRRFSSRFNAFVFGRLLHGLPVDIQSGLKLVRKEIFDHLDSALVGPWSIDIPLLVTAQDLGYQVKSVDISYERRTNGNSKISFLSTALDIAWGALKTKMVRRRTYQLSPDQSTSMIGGGVVHRRKRFITHSTLPHHNSALTTVKPWQQIAAMILLSAVVAGFILDATLTAVVVVAILSTIYFADVWFNLFLILKSLRHEPVLDVSDDDIRQLDDRRLPVYSILCPLYREARVIPQFLDGLRSIDWPKDKLDVQLLLEEDDDETIGAVRGMELPSYVRMTIVPNSQPKTKPKACNYGLSHATGEYVVIYDAEDSPDPKQLKKAYLAFRKSPRNVFCLQAKLNYYNPDHNILTRLFTAEYSLWFDVILPGLQSIETAIPLGGTSNHFRRRDLLALHGWDPFNVTEDCDLGVRLFKAGYQTAIINSTTLEEANSNVVNWIRQRSRWIKGYMQTYLVHMRNPLDFVRRRGIHALIFQLTVGGKIAFMLINPILWVATIAYFTLYRFVGPAIEALYPTPIFYMAVTSLVFGNFLYLYYYMIGCAKRGHWPVVKYVFLIPFYWLMVSVGAGMAFVQLLFKPHYWEKTHHGLHALAQERRRQQALARVKAREAAHARWQRFRELATTGVASGGLLIAASMAANILNFLTNTFLGRSVSLVEFGSVGLVGSFFFLSQIIFGALSTTVTYRSAYLLGKNNKPELGFWNQYKDRVMKCALIATFGWLVLTPVLSGVFHITSIIPLLLFAPALALGLITAFDGGFLSGSLKFGTIALATIAGPLVRLVVSAAGAVSGGTALIYASIPLSVAVPALIFRRSVRRQASSLRDIGTPHVYRFPKRFFTVALLTTLADSAFLSLDVVLAKLFLPPVDAGAYALLSLVGKTIFFVGTLFSRFTLPLVSREEGAQRNSTSLFHKLLAATAVSTAFMYGFIGLYAPLTVPILFGPRSSAIVQFLPFYGLAMVFFSLASTIVTSHQARKHHVFPVLGFLFAILQIASMSLFHATIGMITLVILALTGTYLTTTVVLHLTYRRVIALMENAKDFVGLFLPVPALAVAGKKERILITNWRDTKHVWAGGAEVYIHELAKRWVKAGHPVTLFCGNDEKHPRNEVVDGVHVIRRGGFFTVYVWAFLYYILRLRHRVDVIIDCENGIPFFTPLYARKKIFLLIHHIHQDVFRRGLRPPFSWIASLLELRLMPFVYRTTKILTVSPSSKADILNLGFKAQDPDIIYAGVDEATYRPGKKSAIPMILYLGRLKFYKSVDVLLRAATSIIERIPTVRIVIAGDGEETPSLVRLAKTLGIEQHVQFLGAVDEDEKVKLYQQAWVFVNPSLIEGWGITSIEANACGTPVVASNVAGLRDSIYNPHSGMLVQYGNSGEFSGVILKLLENSRMRGRMSREAIEWANRFNWDTSAEKMLTLIKS